MSDRTSAKAKLKQQKCERKKDNEETYESKLNEKRIRIKRASGDVEKSSPISLVSHSVRSSVTVVVSQRRRWQPIMSPDNATSAWHVGRVAINTFKSLKEIPVTSYQSSCRYRKPQSQQTTLKSTWCKKVINKSSLFLCCKLIISDKTAHISISVTGSAYWLTRSYLT